MRVSIALTALLLGAAGCAEQEASLRVNLRSNRLPDGVFDRLTIEVRERGASAPCAGCLREFEATALTRTGEASFAVVAPTRPVVVRAVLWRSRGKGIRPSSSVAVTVAGEATGAVELRLAWDAVGRELGSWEQPGAAAAVPALPVDPVIRSACREPPDEDEVCVPGGIFWMGDPSIDVLGGVDREGTQERLVWLSPFRLDRAEVTVGQLRASGLATLFHPVTREQDKACVYTAKPGVFEDRPVTCATWELAAEFCQARGRRLPTEAELEYVMGGLRSRRYVWGDDAPECDDTVFGEGECGRSAPEVAGRGRRDRLAVGEREVVDLVGNVIEWAADRWNSSKEACFEPALLRDPRCEQLSPSHPKRRVVRGGGWTVDRSYLGAQLRTGLDGVHAYSEEVGFRCARGEAP